MARRLVPIFCFLLIVSIGWAQEMPATASFLPGVYHGRVFPTQSEAFQPSLIVRTPWQLLDRMSPEDRANCVIQLDIPSTARTEVRLLARRVEEEWNNADYEEAITTTHELCSRFGSEEVEIGFQWKKPRTSLQKNLLATNVRIGEIDSALAVSLASDSSASRLYCVISQLGDEYSGSWHLYLSTDKGATWANTYTQAGTGNAPKTALIVTRSYLYVASLPYPSQKYLRIKKFNAGTGAVTTMTNGATLHDVLHLTDTDAFKEISACGELYGTGRWMHLVASTTAKRLRYVYSYDYRDTSWSEIVDSAATAVEKGLSFAFNYGSRGGQAFISYSDTVGRVCIDSIHVGEGRFGRAFTWPNADGMTSVSAYGDTVLCAYDRYAGATKHFGYLVNYKGGDGSWSYGFPEDTSETTESAVAMLEKGQGIGLFYRFYTPTGREGRFVYRSYRLTSAGWSPPETVTDCSPHYIRPGIVALGEKTWGIAYIVSNFDPALGSVFFVRHQFVPTGVAEEGALTPVSHALHQNYPNPFNPVTNIGYSVGELGSRQQAIGSRVVKLAVYDLLGREVAVLVDEQKLPGEYTAAWDASGMASGIYFCRMEAEGFSAARKLVLMK